ncbi:hypothetical protein K1I42_04685 [Hydrogenophilus thermoluteolus]|nr:hypothetical protein [Hydrogenophilus thermoluteolus]MBW7656585.1 hypothetical protein [Hydrogenophilus thermoluteolus]
MAYVDGFNLYFGLKDSNFKRYYWLDVALIVSGDSDLTAPVCRVRERFPAKRLIVAFPPGRSSSDLKRFAHGYLTIGEDKLRASQLPEQLVKPDGYVLTRPATWR